MRMIGPVVARAASLTTIEFRRNARWLLRPTIPWAYPDDLAGGCEGGVAYDD